MIGTDFSSPLIAPTSPTIQNANNTRQHNPATSLTINPTMGINPTTAETIGKTVMAIIRTSA